MSDSSLMQAFFDGTDALFYIKDADGRFLLVNRKCAQMLKSSEAECIGKSAYDFVPKQDAEEGTRLDRQVAESGTPGLFKGLVNLPVGPRTLLEQKFPISIPGHPGATAGVALNVTDTEKGN